MVKSAVADPTVEDQVVRPDNAADEVTEVDSVAELEDHLDEWEDLEELIEDKDLNLSVPLGYELELDASLRFEKLIEYRQNNLLGKANKHLNSQMSDQHTKAAGAALQVIKLIETRWRNRGELAKLRRQSEVIGDIQLQTIQSNRERARLERERQTRG